MEIKVTWTQLKSLLASKNLYLQYVDTGSFYLVYGPDVGFFWLAEIPKDGGADQDDFEDNYKANSNKDLNVYQQPLCQITKPTYGTRAWTFSHNFCDKTTWYGDSVRVVNEAVGTGDGSTVTFNLDHTYVIDTTHGKISEENYLVPTAGQGGTTYEPEIKVDGVTKTEREFGEASGGDYTINYAAGTVTFFTAPANGLAITATYFYSPTDDGSTVYIRPSTGKKTVITSAECQFSADIDLTDTLISAIYTYNPYLGSPPAKFEYPGSRSYYKRLTDYVAYTNGSFPAVPVMGGSARGTTQQIYQLRFEYVTTVQLDDAYGAELRIWLKHHRPFNGEIGQITFYGYEP